MNRRLVLSFVLAGAVLGLHGLPVAAQRGGPAGPATIEFIATSTDGQMVTDLTAAQLTLRVGNRDRQISSLERVTFGATASTLGTPFGTNSLAEAGRSVMVVVDEESLRPGLENVVRDALLAFEKTLNGNDRIGLFTVPRGATSLAPTTDREAFRAAAAKLQGRQKSTMTASERRCHTRDVIVALNGILTAAPPSGGLTPVLFFTTSLVGPSTGGAAIGDADECFLQPSEFQKVGAGADAINAQFYLVRPEQTSSSTAAEGIQNVLGVTGGTMVFLGDGAGDDPMARIARETSSYYVATFQAEGTERSGMSTRVDLKSTREGVTVRARNSVMIPRASADAPTPQSMLRELTVHRGFGLRAIGIASRNDGDAKNDMKLLALAEPVDPSVKFKSAAAGLYDPAGKLIAQWTARPEELQRSPMVAALAMPAGQYRLRVAAVDTSGRAATVDYEVFARIADAGPAKIGGLMIGAAGGSGFAPIIRITNEQEVIAVFELYGRPAGPFGAIVEILDSPTAEKALVEAPPQPSATPVQDKFMFMAKLPVASLKPGDYVLRARLGFEGAPTGTLTQIIRKQ
ncbi:MAG: hypothetical protein AMXMBFR57_23310 [Acidimicrobiia bacterium]